MISSYPSMKPSHHNYKNVFFTKLFSVSGNRITCHDDGMQAIEKCLEGQITLVAMEGDPSTLFRHVIGDDPQKAKMRQPETCVLISEQPIEDPKTRKNYFLLQTYTKNTEEQIRIHSLLASICGLIVVNCSHETHLTFLASLYGRVQLSYERSSGELKNNISTIMGLVRNDQHGMNNIPLKNNDEQLMNLFTKQNVRDYVLENYECLGGFWMPEDKQLGLINRNMYGDLFQIFAKDSKIKDNSDLMYGPILKAYIEALVSQYNRTGSIILKKAQDDIELEEGYIAFNASVDRYHEFCKQDFNRKAVHNVQQVFMRNSKKAEQSYKKMSKDPKYLSYLHDYIVHKEHELRQANNRLHDAENLEMLKSDSEDLVEKVSRAKSEGRDTSFLKPQLQKIVNKYERQAGGDNKHKLLSEYLNTFVPNLFGDEMGNSKNLSMIQQQKMKEQIQKSKIENKKLKSRINQLEQKKKKKDTCCQIM